MQASIMATATEVKLFGKWSFDDVEVSSAAVGVRDAGGIAYALVGN